MRLVEGGGFMVRKAFPGVGRGLFTVYAFSGGDFVLEYSGKRIPTGSAEDAGSRYLFLVDDEWTIDGPVPENTAGYMNHACDPNCEARAEDGRILFFAKRAIPSGTELTINYGPEYLKKFIEPSGCRCSTCRNP